MEAHGWTAFDVHLRRPTMSRQLVESVLAGRRTGDTEFVRQELTEFLAQVETGRWDAPAGGEVVDIRDARRGRSRRRAQPKTHYETQLVQDVRRALEFAATRAQIVLVTGSYGLGKTHTIERWMLERGREEPAFCFRFHSANQTHRHVFIEQLAARLGVETPPVVSAQTAAVAYDRVVEFLREQPALLIFDQCEVVRLALLQTIRDIWDDTREAGVGMALFASEELYLRLTRSRAGALGALTSRISGHFLLRGLDAGELRAIAQAEGVEIDEATAQTWSTLAGGSMRRFLETLELLKAAHGGRAVTPKTVEGLFAMQI